MGAATTPIDWTGGPALLWVLGAALVYWLGGPRRRRPAQSVDRWRTAAFAGGLGAILVALDSPLDGLADELFWVHMTQHILLIGVATPLLALARPWMRMWHGVPAAVRRPVTRSIARSPRWAPARRAAGFAGGALASWLIFNVTFCAWHLPALYDAALRSPACPCSRALHLLRDRAALLDPGDRFASVALPAQRAREDRLPRFDARRRLGAGNRVGPGHVPVVLRLLGGGE